MSLSLDLFFGASGRQRSFPSLERRSADLIEKKKRSSSLLLLLSLFSHLLSSPGALLKINFDQLRRKKQRMRLSFKERKSGARKTIFLAPWLAFATGPKRARETSVVGRREPNFPSLSLPPDGEASLASSQRQIRDTENKRTLPSVIVDESAGMMTSLTALAWTLPRRGAASDDDAGRGAAAMAPPAEGRAAAGAEAGARVTADCIVAGCRRKWGSAGALGSGRAGGNGGAK